MADDSAPEAGGCEKKIFIAVRIIGACCAVSLIVIGALGLVGAPKIRQLVDSVFFIMFGTLFIAAEVRFGMFLHYFSFLKTPLGLGVAYIFVGLRAFGWPWWRYIVMILAFTPGAFYLILACTCSKLYQRDQKDTAAVDEKKNQLQDPLLDPANDPNLSSAAASIGAEFGKQAVSNPAIRDAAISAASAAVTAAVKEALPPNWETRTDEGSGSTYFYNSRTGEMSWDRPSG
uniref:WW domain-containing protein n=2 Tax=Lotharella globosa TaxID=91324 RepID=A0A6U3CF06_9EUKA|mmetsp:Transcript_34181/g.66566  ORF Transcript_34181/g.66566 Transcript_34181/m.66566 type:complete len:231 (-) Transcript_34181:212-904(-)